MNSLGVIEKNGKFIVVKNGEPIILPKSEGQAIITEFDTKNDAEKYITILSKLQKNKAYR